MDLSSIESEFLYRERGMGGVSFGAGGGSTFVPLLQISWPYILRVFSLKWVSAYLLLENNADNCFWL